MEKQFNGVADMPDLHGKVVVVTGGSSGIGFVLVKRLVQKGAKVYFTTRTEAKAEATKEALVHDPSIKPDNISWLVMDFMDPATVCHAIDVLKTKERKVDILINNAAVSVGSTELVAGGYEQHMVGNHMGPFLLVNRILPLLKNATKDKEADVRIISFSSTAPISMLPRNFNFQFSHKSGLTEPVTQWPWAWRYVGRFMFGFDMIRYAVSKAAVVLFIKELQRRLDEQGVPILCMAVHPGEVATETLLEINSPPLRAIARMSFLTAEQGALPPLFAATASEVRKNAAKYKGQFIMPIGKIGTPNPVANDDRQVKGLWDVTTIEVNKQLAALVLPGLQAW
ncbi:hypothetical protein BGZ61DRAFT_367364 [Ilyonectria robusta]|uniref:uncharacterized protein n=1 Tax=Ilyonectria robusta TaxID=1079257 RepID=UPI001E8DC97A|nr:uncharacterized protein BGZ61DRAFT_367364 [Ilyonectria robusta]KAH8663750.1 hypothetical protein BGZ61DRAFT_367364 [Ilyonectria robusta]